ncbi:LexA family transcriptional regulator [uncultured Gimesia sp.]|jgi:SOS-response transcriptional repressor LexA|uniref:LexA family protein n=1 Tax=uncultured Gimesia sp. TaxID=1678688 RepID=UPI00262BE061|nr:LexA family transcriptional regulator [uncultured Gimesia sp.]
MKRLTEKQKRILSFIRVFTVKTGCAPTVREIGQTFGIKSTNGVSCHLKAIEAKGRLKRNEFMPRGIEVLDNLRIRFGGEVG